MVGFKLAMMLRISPMTVTKKPITGATTTTNLNKTRFVLPMSSV
jgi:hypothetical protein